MAFFFGARKFYVRPAAIWMVPHFFLAFFCAGRMGGDFTPPNPRAPSHLSLSLRSAAPGIRKGEHYRRDRDERGGGKRVKSEKGSLII